MSEFTVNKFKCSKCGMTVQMESDTKAGSEKSITCKRCKIPMIKEEKQKE